MSERFFPGSSEMTAMEQAGVPGLSPDESEALYRALLAVDELPDRLAILGSVVRRLGPIDGYLFAFRGETGGALVCQGVSLPGEFKDVEPAYRDFRFPLAGGDPEELVRCFLSREVIEVDGGNIEGCHANTCTRFERWRMRSLAFLPVVRDGEAVGALMLFSQREAIDAVALESISVLVNGLSPALLSAQVYTALSEGRADYLRSGIEREQLIEFFSEAGVLGPLEELCPRLIERFLLFFPFDFMVLFLVEGEKLVPRHWGSLSEATRAAVGRVVAASPPYDLDVSAGALPIVVLRKMTMNFPDAQKAMRFRSSDTDADWLDRIAAEGIALRTIVHVPVLVGQRAIGLLSCYAASRTVDLDKGQIRRMELLARFFGSAIENAKLYTEVQRLNEKLREQATHDPLTGVYNFGYLQEDLDRRIHEYWRCPPGQGRALSMIILDIDHFKHFNDTYGHLAGNVALVEVSACVVRLARRTDVVCRYGGEEFVVILSGCNLAEAAHFAERLRSAVAAVAIPLDDEPPTHLTISLGVAEYDGTESLTRFMERADQALYRAKHGGRNRVETAADPAP